MALLVRVFFCLFVLVCRVFCGFVEVLFVVFLSFVCLFSGLFLIVAWFVKLLCIKLLVLDNIYSGNNKFVFTCAVGKGCNRQRNFD